MYSFKNVKLTHLIFILIICPFNNYMFSQDSEKLIIQNERIEFEFKFLDRNYWAIKNKKRILVINDFETGDKLIWKFKLLDLKLNLLSENEINLDRSYRIKDHFSIEDNIFILYKKDYSNDKEYKIIIINSSDNSIKEYQIHTPFSIKVTQIKYISGNIILSGKSNQNRSIVVLYDTISNQLKILSGFYKLNQEILNIKIGDSNNYFSIIYVASNSNNVSELVKKNYTVEGNEIASLGIKSNNYSFIDGKFYNINNNQHIVIGTYGRKNSRYTRGLFFSKIENDQQTFIKFYDYSKMENFFYYLKDKKEKKIKKKIVKKDNLKKNMKLSYNLIIDDVNENDSLFLISGESYFEEYNERGFYPTITFYNAYSGNYDKALDPNFSGYNHTHSIIAAFNIDGELIWDNSIDITDIISFEEKKYVKISINDNTKDIAMIYFHKGVISLKIINERRNLTDKKSYPLNPLKKNDIILESEKLMEGLEHWYDNYYFTYGIQKIRNIKDNDIKLKRRVFYINKIQLNN